MIDPRDGRGCRRSAHASYSVILHSLLKGGEELIAVFSLSFSISPALSPSLSLKLMCGVTVKPPRPIHSGTPHPNSLCSVCITAPAPLALGSQSRSTALNLKLAHLLPPPHSPLPCSRPISPLYPFPPAPLGAR